MPHIGIALGSEGADGRVVRQVWNHLVAVFVRLLPARVASAVPAPSGWYRHPVRQHSLTEIEPVPHLPRFTVPVFHHQTDRPDLGSAQ